jgi:hypothetical protein
MCDDRERLIGYIYDECDAAERERIEEHLAGCLDCRQEIAALRTVREDLLAWDVPRHATIWRPVTPERVTWRTVPGWAMAAAAALMLMSGAAGGAVAQMLLSQPEGGVVQTDAAPIMAASVQASPGSTAAEVAALEQRLAAIRAELRAEMEDRVRRISTDRSQRAGAAEVPEEFRQLVTLLANQVNGVQAGLEGVEGKVESVMALTQPQAVPVSFQPGQ